MLKKFLTTIIVLAATATAWADGWSVTYDTNGCHDATITKSADGTMTLAGAIEEVNSKTKEENGNLVYVQKVIIVAESMTEEEVTALGAITQNHVDLSSAKELTNFFTLPKCVKYVILPDGMTKEQVNNVGTSFDAAVSMGAHTKTVWRYDTYNTTGIEYTGVRYNETVVDGTAQATGKVSATVNISNPTTLYYGKVFYDKSGNAYQTSDDSKSVQLSSYTKRYTYVDENENGEIRLWPNTNTNGHTYYVVSKNGGYVGVQDPTIVTVAKKDVKYTYKKGGKTYAYNEEPKYKIGSGQYVICEGGTEFSIQEENTYTLNEATNTYNSQNGRLVTNNNKGHVDGTKIPLTKVSAYYVLKTNNIYEGPIRIDGEKAYGHGGTPVELSLVYYYDNGTVTEAGEGFYVSYDDKRIAPIKDDYGNNNGDWKPAKKEGDSWYIDYGGGYQLDTNVTEDEVYKSIDGSQLYVNWNSPKTYDVTSYGYKYEGTPYNGQVYTKDGIYYGYTDGAEIELENRITYVKDDNTVYTEDVYTYNNEYFGYDGGTQVTIDSKKYFNYYGTKIYVNSETPITLDEKNVYWGYNNIEPTVYILELYNGTGYVTNDAELFPETGIVYNETTGLIGGEETPVTYSAEGYYYNTDYIYTGEYVTKKANDYDSVYGCTDNSVLSPLEAVYQYTYTDPINGETVVYETMEQESSVTVTHDVTVTAYEESAGNIHLTAYVSKPGSLKFALARWGELGNNTASFYAVGNVTALTLSGDVNYADIGQNPGNFSISDYGHVTYWDSEQRQYVTPDNTVQDSPNNIENNQAAMNGNALTYLDLENAVFAVQTDMQFSKVNGGLKTIILPTDNSMTLIPDNAFNNLQYVSELCIPYNYTTIGSGAFYNTHALMHIYTTDNPDDDGLEENDDETTVDHGPYTFTFSANLKQIEGGDVAESGTTSTFFGKDIEQVTDVYVLATKAPKCGATAFAGHMTYGNNGFAGNWTHPICRENYNNSKRWMCILHFPSECADNGEDKNYTDITRNYTLADETGAVDGRGKALLWPRHAEFYRSYNQAIKGHIWYDWKEYAGNSNEVIESYTEGVLSDKVTGYNQEDYQGWHEFVLTGNSRSREFDAQAENTEFIQRDWYTLCVPYDMTKSHFLEVFGVDPTKSTNNQVTMLDGTIEENISEAMYPDVRVVTHISRSVNDRKMIIHFSKPLINDTENKNWEVVIPENGQGYEYRELAGDDPIIIKGGHPFLVRGYVPAAWNDQIKNLGMYIMAIAETDNATAMANGASEEELPYKYNKDCLVNGVSLPCVDHHIHALNADQTVGENKVYVYEDAAQQTPACYHFIGTYSATTVPQYAYYLGKNKTTKEHQFFRTTKETTKWNPYSAVIIGLNNPEYNNNDFAEGSSSKLKNIIVGWNTPKSDLVILEGEDLARAGQALSLIFDEGVADDTTTGITDVDVNVNVSNNKVYSINGQYMGTSLNKLPKGIYIINGQKKVVK